jgi:hypothetical protein
MLRQLSAASLNNRLASVSLAWSLACLLSFRIRRPWRGTLLPSTPSTPAESALQVYVVKWPQGSSLWLTPMRAEGSALVAFGFVQAIM